MTPTADLLIEDLVKKLTKDRNAKIEEFVVRGNNIGCGVRVTDYKNGNYKVSLDTRLAPGVINYRRKGW